MWVPLAIATDSRSGLKTFSTTAIACLTLCSALQAQVTVNTGSGTIIELYN